MNGTRQAQQSSPLVQRSMAELESEELSIRNSTSLSPTEKQLQLHRVWKEQRDLANLRTASPSDSPAPSHQEQPDRSSAATSAPDPAQSTTQKTSIPEETKKSQPPTSARGLSDASTRRCVTRGGRQADAASSLTAAPCSRCHGPT
jgi:hypothetical protein